MKTIREWLESIEDDTIREAAIRNAEDEGTTNKYAVTLAAAISSAFIFRMTNQGPYYWWNIMKQAAAGTLKTKEQ